MLLFHRTMQVPQMLVEYCSRNKMLAYATGTKGGGGAVVLRVGVRQKHKINVFTNLMSLLAHRLQNTYRRKYLHHHVNFGMLENQQQVMSRNPSGNYKC